MKYLKFSSMALLALWFVASVLLVGKMIKSDISPDRFLLSEDREAENRVEPALAGEEEVTIKFNKNTSYIFAIQDKGNGEAKVELITPSKAFDPSHESHHDKQTQNLLMQIVSGSRDANAGHCRDTHYKCSGVYYRDSMGTIREYCWCSY